jgi:predicted molibdopterin-dependent oxidoreductase YjgC
MSIKIIIDNVEYTARAGQTVLDVAKENKVHIPTICYNPLFGEERSGLCRMCVVEVTAGGRPGLQSACTLPVNDGLTLVTNSESVFQERRAVIELLLSEHIQDCRNCSISGDCMFAEYSKDYDVNGVPVCAECPNQKEGCLLSRGILCMGPITFSGCGAFCTRRGYKCEGCFTIHTSEHVLKFGLEAYKNAGFTPEQILEAAEIFSVERIGLLKKMMAESGCCVVKEVE